MEQANEVVGMRMQVSHEEGKVIQPSINDMSQLGQFCHAMMTWAENSLWLKANFTTLCEYLQ
jgi:hypothetical protein